MKLELKHLSPYLPYGLKAKLSNEGIFNLDSEYPNEFANEICTIKDFNLSHSEFSGSMVVDKSSKGYSFDFNNLSEIEIILRPLSTIDLKWFKDNIGEHIEDFRINCEPENNHFSVEVCDKLLGWSALSLEEYQLFFEHHVDVFGLIEKGLAIDINTI